MSKKKSASKDSLLELDFNNVMAEVLGPDMGLAKAELDELKPKLTEAHKALMNRRKQGELPFYDLPFQTRELRKLRRSADEIRRKVDNFVVLGIGGSALGTSAVFKALRPLNHNLVERAKRRFPRLFVADNVDPEGMAALLNLVDPRRTIFNVVSKSGTTAETMAQFMDVYDQIRRSLGKSSLKEHIIFTTDPENGLLRSLGNKVGFECFDVPPGVGGRFSVLTPVGLLPLAVAGVNVAELLRGAAAAAEVCAKSALWTNPAYLFAALTYTLHRRKGRSILVMMPYADALAGMADWFNQLWAESLGKRLSTDGRVVWAGQTPIKAVGATDQHSQVQLYIEGPQDKVVVFLGVNAYRVEVRIPQLFKEDEGIAYLGGHTLGELIRTEQAATARALAMAGRPNMTFTMPKVTPASLGYLIYVLEVATVISGYLYGVDPLDQPGVEMGKQYTYGLMGRPGFESFKTAYNKGPTPKKKFILQ
ncbi:MAG: glucose-6-phosphate isomerase [Thermodesulfobacteriota bacterium]|nr:glucose-6-phosphate isomerase [Thermodesulfobacteriota bacterium]